MLAEMNIRDKTDNLRVMRKEATLELKEAPTQERKVFFSIETQEILERRGKALERGEEEEYQRLAKEFRKKSEISHKIFYAFYAFIKNAKSVKKRRKKIKTQNHFINCVKLIKNNIYSICNNEYSLYL